MKKLIFAAFCCVLFGCNSKPTKYCNDSIRVPDISVFSVKIEQSVFNPYDNVQEYWIEYKSEQTVGEWRYLNGVENGRIGAASYSFEKAKSIAQMLKTYQHVKRYTDSVVRLMPTPYTLKIR